ncbi:hypothetical protein [Nitrosomonas sp. Nm84]|uniref:hypothetical protein n=1 Tax=Nitrosomonas sp. Nm84 TaxID=200124 RepID=UPI001C64AF14|nr:hypothetical protein [Nitrosomonas sp. Nm84]
MVKRDQLCFTYRNQLVLWNLTNTARMNALSYPAGSWKAQSLMREAVVHVTRCNKNA